MLQQDSKVMINYLCLHNSWGNKRHMMATTRLQDLAEPAVFVPTVAKQQDEFVRVIAFGILVSARANLLLDEISRKIIECFNEHFSKPELVRPTDTAKPARTCF